MKPGIAFGDHIKTEKTPKFRYNAEASVAMRSYFLLFLLGTITIILFSRLVFLQLIQGSYYRKLSDVNRTRTVIIHAPRGIIQDRNRVPLVYNIPGFRSVEKEETTLLGKEEALRLIASGRKNIEVDNLRQYPFKDAFSHVIGYTGQITEENIKMPQYANYLATDYIGKSGLEKEYEQILKGVDGKELVEVDALGKVIRTLGKTDPTSGRDITVTLDANLQKAAYDAMKDIPKGSVIVSRPNGEILTLLSKPSYDPNLFTLDKTYTPASDSAYTKVSQIILDNANQPLLDRSVSGTYPPGSTFKIITAAAGLEQKVIDERYTITDTGVVTLGAFSFANWFYTDHGQTEKGPVDVRRALGRSNDIFFYKLADLLQVDRISLTAEKFGIGKKLGIDIGGEESGILPTKKWKEENMKEQWYLGDTYHYGIGQGYLLTTPLQVNIFTQAVANRGVMFQPHLLLSKPEKILQKNLLSLKTYKLLEEGMNQACDTGGTAFPLFEFKVQNSDLVIDNKNFFGVNGASGSADTRHVSISCKTGTAQHGDEHTLPHAWITLYAPSENPEIIVTVLAESSGDGSKFAGPVAKKILEEYFRKK